MRLPPNKADGFVGLLLNGMVAFEVRELNES